MMTLAHGFYIDEILWFVVPVAVSLWLLRWAERKARLRAEADESDESGHPTD